MKNVVLSVVMLFSGILAFSQTENNYDDSKVRFGFNLGANYSNLLSKDISGKSFSKYSSISLLVSKITASTLLFFNISK